MTTDNTVLSEATSKSAKDLICWDELSSAVLTARELFKTIIIRYPELKPYLVMCCHGSQIDIPENPLSVLTQSQRMVADDHVKHAVIKLLCLMDNVKVKFRDELEQQLTALSKEIRFITDITFEVRFERLVYESIWRLQRDPLIDRERTPQSKASIRVVFKHFKELPRLN